MHNQEMKYIYFALKVAALTQHYSKLTLDEIKLKRADFIGHYLIPTLASIFVAGYWILGLMKYNSPNWFA